jgi:hypothetical protein
MWSVVWLAVETGWLWMCLSHVSAVFAPVLWWARIMSGLKRRSGRRIAAARLRTGLANVGRSQTCPFVPVGIPVRAMSPASATRPAVGLPALAILQLIGDVFVLWRLGHALLPSQKSGAAPQEN